MSALVWQARATSSHATAAHGGWNQARTSSSHAAAANGGSWSQGWNGGGAAGDQGGWKNGGWNQANNGSQGWKDKKWEDKSSWNQGSQGWQDKGAKWKDAGSNSWQQSGWKKNGGAGGGGGRGNFPDAGSGVRSWGSGVGTTQFTRAFLPADTPASAEERQAAERRREELEIHVEGEPGGCCVAPVSSLDEVRDVIPTYAVEQLVELGMDSPMPIQQQALPLLLRGLDLVGIAKTGSGKTLAFLLPGVAHIEAQAPLSGGTPSPIALVLAPVRELAVQIAEEAAKLLVKSAAGSHPNGLGAIALYGGGYRVRWDQHEELKKGQCHIIAATPGRLCDFLESGDITLERVTYFVLDEADRMLDCGFEEQMGQIAQGIRSDRQTLFFSATWPSEVQKLASRMCLTPPVRVTFGQKSSGDGPTARADIVQEIVVFDGLGWEETDKQKQEKMYAHLRCLLTDPAHKVLVFVNTKNLSWEVAGKLNEEGFIAEFMYGGRSQDVRADIVKKFKEGEIKLLVTTDVMARGLDIPEISHVVVFDCYGGIDEYVHRIGRTARGPYGRGHALTFYEYDPKYSDMAGKLIEVLEQAGQTVPPELQQIADEVMSGERKVVKRKW